MKVPFESVEQAARRAAGLVSKELPHGAQFILIAMTTGADGFLTYVSNVRRDDAVRVVDEWRESMKTRGFEDYDLGTSCWLCGEKVALVTLRGKHRSVDICAKCILQNEK